MYPRNIIEDFGHDSTRELLIYKVGQVDVSRGMEVLLPEVPGRGGLQPGHSVCLGRWQAEIELYS